MHALSLYDLAIGMHVNSWKSKLLLLHEEAWHHILCPEDIVSPTQLVQNLSNPLKWMATQGTGS